MNLYDYRFLSFIGKVKANNMIEALCLVLEENKKYIDERLSDIDNALKQILNLLLDNQSIPNIPIENMNLPTRILNLCKRDDIKTLDVLLQIKPHQFRMRINVGAKSFDIFLLELRRYNITIKNNNWNYGHKNTVAEL